MAHGMRHRDISDALNDTIYSINGGAIAVHEELGPGVLESVYEVALGQELRDRGHIIETQIPVPLHYKGRDLDHSLRLDMLVDSQVIVEVKAVEQVLPVHLAQVRSYLRLANKPVGLLLNFKVPAMKDGWQRVFP